MRALIKKANWKTAYLDNTQHLLVNIETHQGKQLIDKILSDEAVFPDVYSKSITTSTAILENNYRQRTNDLYTMSKVAFEERQDQSTTLLIIEIVKRIPGLRMKNAADLQAYVDDFTQHKDDYQKQDGYSLRLSSAELSARFLSQLLPEQKKEFANLAATLRSESQSLSLAHIW